jgi:hypothetical protein
MTQGCFPDAALDQVAGWDPADPRRAHLDACPGCRARLAAYLSFVKAEDVPGADPEDAEARLSAVLAGLAGASAAAPPRATRPRRARWLRPALAVAATLVVAVGLWRGLAAVSARPAAGLVLRGEGEARPAPVVQPARALDGGRLALSWRRQPQADAYRVALHDADLRQVAVLDAGADSTLAVTPGAARYWRVLALRGGAEIGRTELAPLRAVE